MVKTTTIRSENVPNRPQFLLFFSPSQPSIKLAEVATGENSSPEPVGLASII